MTRGGEQQEADGNKGFTKKQPRPLHLKKKQLAVKRETAYYPSFFRGGSSIGRAPRSQRGGREFDPPPLHSTNQSVQSTHMKLRTLLIIILHVLIAPLYGMSSENNPALKSTPTLTLELATRMVEVAARYAEELHHTVGIIIIGTDGFPLVLRRHEETPGIVYEQTLKSARSAWVSKKETESSFPIIIDGQRLGGIGVGGATQSINKQIGTEALSVFHETVAKKSPVLSANKELLKIILYVRRSEMLETTDFYSNTIGLHQRSSSNLTWNEFEAGSVTLCLHVKDKNSSREKATNIALYSGTREDVKALHARLIDQGYSVTSDINPKRDKTMGRLQEKATMTTFWIKDPAGNTVQLESLRTN